MKKKLIALLVCLTLTLTNTGVYAEEAPAAVEEEEATPKPTEAPTPEPTEAPTPEPTEAPTPEPTEAPTEETSEETSEEASEETSEEATEAPKAEESAEASDETDDAEPEDAPELYEASPVAGFKAIGDIAAPAVKPSLEDAKKLLPAKLTDKDDNTEYDIVWSCADYDSEAVSYTFTSAFAGEAPELGEGVKMPTYTFTFLYHELEDGGLKAITYEGDPETLTIPSEYEEEKVIAVGADFFKGKTALNELTLTDTLESFEAAIPSDVEKLTLVVSLESKLSDGGKTVSHEVVDKDEQTVTRTVTLDKAYTDIEVNDGATLTVLGEDEIDAGVTNNGTIINCEGLLKNAPVSHDFGEDDVCKVCDAKKGTILFEDGTAVSYVGDVETLEIPDMNGETPVTAIGEDFFKEKTALTGLTITDAITSAPALPETVTALTLNVNGETALTDGKTVFDTAFTAINVAEGAKLTVSGTAEVEAEVNNSGTIVNCNGLLKNAPVSHDFGEDDICKVCDVKKGTILFDGGTAVSYVGDVETLEIPAMNGETPVTAIGEDFFKDKTLLTSLTITDAITSAPALPETVTALTLNVNGETTLTDGKTVFTKVFTAINVAEGATLNVTGSKEITAEVTNAGTICNCRGLLKGELPGTVVTKHNYENSVCTHCGRIKLKITYNHDACTKVYDKTKNTYLKASDFTVKGIEKGDSVTLKVSAKFGDIKVGSYDIRVSFTLDGDDKAEYAADAITIKGKISKRKIMIKPQANQYKYYSEADATIKGTVLKQDGTGLLKGDTIAGKLGRMEGEDAGKYIITAGTLDAGENYEIVITEETEYTILPISLGKEGHKLDVPSVGAQKWTGSPITPKYTVKFDDKVLEEGKDYTVTCTNNTDVGTATVIIQAQGNYSGKISTSFRIYKTSTGGSTSGSSSSGSSSSWSGSSSSWSGSSSGSSSTGWKYNTTPYSASNIESDSEADEDNPFNNRFGTSDTEETETGNSWSDFDGYTLTINGQDYGNILFDALEEPAEFTFDIITDEDNLVLDVVENDEALSEDTAETEDEDLAEGLSVADIDETAAAANLPAVDYSLFVYAEPVKDAETGIPVSYNNSDVRSDYDYRCLRLTRETLDALTADTCIEARYVLENAAITIDPAQLVWPDTADTLEIVIMQVEASGYEGYRAASNVYMVSVDFKRTQEDGSLVTVAREEGEISGIALQILPDELVMNDAELCRWGTPSEKPEDSTEEPLVREVEHEYWVERAITENGVYRLFIDEAEAEDLESEVDLEDYDGVTPPELELEDDEEDGWEDDGEDWEDAWNDDHEDDNEDDNEDEEEDFEGYSEFV